MPKQRDKQFKLNAVRYYKEHKKLGLRGCADNLNIAHSTLGKWNKELRNTDEIKSRRSGNYGSDKSKEIVRLKRELRDTQDALDVLRKAIDILGK